MQIKCKRSTFKRKKNMHGELPKQRQLMGKNKKIDVTVVKGKLRTKPTLVQDNIS